MAPGECVIGTGKPGLNGYHRKMFRGRSYLQHRLAYAARYGEILSDKVVHHRCHNRGCVNPEHLEALTRGEHNLEHILPNLRAHTHCKRGHEFPPLGDKPFRVCKVCDNQRKLNWYYKHKGGLTK